MHDVSNQVIQLLAPAEALMATVVAYHKEGPEHGALGQPVERPYQPACSGIAWISALVRQKKLAA